MTAFGGGMTPVNFYAGLNTKIPSHFITVKSSESNIENANFVCDGTADNVQINAAIDTATALTNGATVCLTDGVFNLTASIVIKSNVRLILTESTKVFLSNGANCYMVQNSAMTAGNTNITISGGRWFGNRTNQTIDQTGDTPELSYYGAGFVFKNITNFYFGDCYIEDTAFFGVLYKDLTNFTFKNIEYLQKNNPSSSQDGIVGSNGNYGLIQNISGYCTDDLIAIAATGVVFTTLGGVDKSWGSAGNSSNITIKDIYLRKNATPTYTCYGIGLYASQGQTLENIIIDGVYGGTSVNVPLIRMINWFHGLAGKGYFKNIDISNLNIEFVTAGQSILNVSDTWVYAETRDVSIRNVKCLNSEDSKKDLITTAHAVANLTVSNITCKNTVGTYKHRLLVSQAQGQASMINITGVDITSDIDPIVLTSVEATGLRINAPQCYTTRSLSVIDGAVIGDQMKENTTMHPMLFTTKWIDIIDGSDI